MRTDNGDLINCSHDKLVPVESLKPNPLNPNTHSAEQVELLAKLIGHTGWRAAITVSTNTGNVVAGHGRLEAAKKLGVTSVPVDYQDFETEEDELAHMVADNRLAELSEIDSEALSALLTELASEGTGLNFDFEATGYTAKEQQKLAEALKPLEYTTTAVKGAGEGQVDRSFENYSNTSVRQIVLIYDGEEYEEVCGRLERLKAELGCETNTEAITRLITNATEEVE